MRKQLSTIAAATLAIAGAGSAHAQDAETDGWYLAASGSVSVLDDAHLVIGGAPVPPGFVETVQAMNTGYGIQAAAGRKFGNFRLEAEAGYTANPSSHYTAIVPPTGRIPSDAKQSALRLMANGYVDFGHGRVQPYVGAGAGWTRVQFRITAPRAPFPTEAPSRLIDTHANRFAWQLMGGAAVRLNPSLSLTAQYRWHSAGDFGGQDFAGRSFTSRHAGHNIDIGIRVRL